MSLWNSHRLRLLTVLFMVGLLAGCFWQSPNPDFADTDAPIRMVVLWDAVPPNPTAPTDSPPLPAKDVVRHGWETDEQALLAPLVARLNTDAWQSSSVLPAGHATRIIVTMQSGKVWELVQSAGQQRRLHMFDRTDRGWSGWLPPSNAFLDALETAIEADVAQSVDLRADHRWALKEGGQRRLTAIAKRALTEFPGYPEIIWDRASQTFAYAAE
ncbi:MAG: hypothetical protein AAF493_00105 [Pseudomonadota bacterium]